MNKNLFKIETLGNGSIEIKELGPLIVTQNDDILVAPQFVGLCGTDVKLINSSYLGATYPLIIGHEWVGKVTMSRNEDIKVGSIITGECSIYCGVCSQCAINLNTCYSLQKFGITVSGAMRSMFWYPSKFTHLLPSVDPYWCFIEPLASVLHLLSKMNLSQKHELEVLIIGSGQIGLLSAFALFSIGRNVKVHVFDIDYQKMMKAKLVLHDKVKLINKDSLMSNMYHIVIDTAGNRSSLDIALKIARKGGQICLLSTDQGMIPVSSIVPNCLSIYGTIGGSGYFKHAIKIINENFKDIRNIPLNIIDVTRTEICTSYSIINPLEKTVFRFNQEWDGY